MPSQVFEHLKEFNKFGIVGKPQPSGGLQMKIFWKTEELKLKKMKMKISNFLCKIAAHCKIIFAIFDYKNFNPFWS